MGLYIVDEIGGVSLCSCVGGFESLVFEMSMANMKKVILSSKCSLSPYSVPLSKFSVKLA